MNAQMVTEFLRRYDVHFGAGLGEIPVKLIRNKIDEFIGESLVETRGLHRNHLAQKPYRFGKSVLAARDPLLHDRKA